MKALDASGNGYISDVIEGIEWCISNEMDIVNMSFGLESASGLLHESVLEHTLPE